jgi:Uma2 family endonuclease
MDIDPRNEGEAIALMTFTKARFASFEEYLTADVSDLPEGRCEYWDGELVEVMAESIGNCSIATFIQLALIAIGIPFKLIHAGKVEVEVPGRPQSRIPDLTVIDDIHLTLLKKRATITRKMPPPWLVVEVVSPGSENSENYTRDYQDKRDQYAAIGISEYWIVDPDRSWVMVGTLVSGAYQFQTFQGDDAIVSPTFPELKLTAAQVLEG